MEKNMYLSIRMILLKKKVIVGHLFVWWVMVCYVFSYAIPTEPTGYFCPQDDWRQGWWENIQFVAMRHPQSFSSINGYGASGFRMCWSSGYMDMEKMATYLYSGIIWVGFQWSDTAVILCVTGLYYLLLNVWHFDCLWDNEGVFKVWQINLKFYSIKSILIWNRLLFDWRC